MRTQLPRSAPLLLVVLAVAASPLVACADVGPPVDRWYDKTSSQVEVVTIVALAVSLLIAVGSIVGLIWFRATPPRVAPPQPTAGSDAGGDAPEPPASSAS